MLSRVELRDIAGVYRARPYESTIAQLCPGMEMWPDWAVDSLFLSSMASKHWRRGPQLKMIGHKCLDTRTVK